MTKPLLYVCPRHNTHVETHLAATVTCVKCGRVLKPVDPASVASTQGALFAPQLDEGVVPQAQGRA
jgi:hypothetical protein